MAKGFLRPAPKTANPVTRRIRILPHLHHEARIAHRTKTIKRVVIKKVAMITIKITTMTAVKAGDGKNP